METTQVKSSNLKSVAYDESTKRLQVTFLKSGSTYTYQDVPKETVTALLAAPSKGSYFSKNVRNSFSFAKLS
jgi:hypothetical protein